MNKPEVLFVCVHNAGRSQMAAALLDHHAAGRVVVRSGGSAPGDAVNPAAVEVMGELGIDLSKRVPQAVTDESVQARTWSSPWAAATLARCTRANVTRIGI